MIKNSLSLFFFSLFLSLPPLSPTPPILFSFFSGCNTRALLGNHLVVVTVGVEEKSEKRRKTLAGVIVSPEEDADKHAEKTVLLGSKMAELISKLNTQKENEKQKEKKKQLQNLNSLKWSH